MLTLPVRRLGKILAVEDETFPDRVHVARLRPRVLLDSSGQPRLRLHRWILPSGTDPGPALSGIGGRLTLDVDLQPTAEDLAEVDLGGRDPAPFQWLDAVFLLDGPGFDPVEADISLAAGTRAALSVDLSPAQAAVLATMLRIDSVSPFQVTFLGHVRLRLPAVEVLATLDVEEVRRRTRELRGSTERVIVQALIEANARIEIRGSENLELEKALREWALDELTVRFARGEDLVFRASAAEVVDWPIRLASTLDGFLPGTLRQELVTDIVIAPGEAAMFPPTEVRALGDFGGPLERVDVEVLPLGGAEVSRLSLVTEEPRFISLGSFDYRFRYRPKLRPSEALPWSSWEERLGSTSLLIPVPVLGRQRIEVAAAGLDFDSRWKSVRVVLDFPISGGGTSSHVMELQGNHLSGFWTPPEGTEGPGQARLTFRSRHGVDIERMVVLDSKELVIRDPFESERLTLSLVPTGSGWDDVFMVMVDLRYGEELLTFEESLELRSLDDFARWEAPALPDDTAQVEWRYHASFENGRFEESDWRKAELPVQTVPLRGVPRRRVQFLPVYFDPQSTRTIEAVLRLDTDSRQVAFSGRQPVTIDLSPGPFMMRLKWTLVDGQTVELEEQEYDEEVIVIPRAPI